MKPTKIPASDDLIIEHDETVWDGRFPLQVVRFRQRRFDGVFSEVRTWELWRRGTAAAMLPYDPVSDQVVLIEQFRLPAHAAGMAGVMVEVPAGLCEPGEDPAETMRREAAEEAGLTVGALLPVGDFLLTPGGCDERVRLFVGQVRAPSGDAEGIAGHGGLVSESEDIRVRVWPAETAIAEALAGRLPNSVTTLALLWLAAKRDWLRREWGGA